MVDRGGDDRAASAAAGWYARLGLDEAEYAGARRLRRWRAAHPSHEQAWRRVQETGAHLDRVAGQPEIDGLIQHARCSHRYHGGRGALWLGLAATLLFVGAGLLIHYGSARLAVPHSGARPSATPQA